MEVVIRIYSRIGILWVNSNAKELRRQALFSSDCWMLLKKFNYYNLFIDNG